ncbi:hypothetical protein BOTBODRAFT_165770 [Botryobasidium botryosum FD-172 SS1]|uniref:Heterokaryon incompatibility domain-containing protein n=1 Tax=Botryobasidium botryosum (strain FD-172 SS1) TaxID=930990 RepID=A0A067MAM6_BOTB1|nr:hypothetical protein BOTBODRAFT_165770 [Botryobasidium botryosum FD-172 SS1]
MSKVILQISLDSLSRSATLPVLDLTLVATPGRFRLIDCAQYLHHGTLSIHEFTEFPIAQCAYTAISYVWRGNSVDVSAVRLTFSVAGAEDGDPVGVDVLKHVCTAALREKTNYIWLDRLCIMQTSKDDKHWQISQMFQIYRRCALCVVLPGGVQRLVELHERTAWINRGWTLQEALAPPRVEVIYAWEWRSGMYYGAFRGSITELIPGESAMTPLRAVLSLQSFGLTTFFPSMNSPHITFRTEIFGAPNDSSPNTTTEQTTEVVTFMLKYALGDTFENFDEQAPAIWRSALFRTSSRPVDMVFSIMGLFGVTLDTRKFHKDDRLGATIALMQEILRGGGRASWLGLAPYLPVNPRLSTIPIFPRTHIEGLVSLEAKSQGIDEQERRPQRVALLDVRGVSMPSGSMDNSGYLTITRKAIRIYPSTRTQHLREDQHDHRVSSATPPLYLKAINHTEWVFDRDLMQDPDQNSPRTFAILLGWFNQFSQKGVWDGPRHIGALLVREHAPDKFHVESYFELNDGLERWVLGSWEEHTLCIGGPSSDVT